MVENENTGNIPENDPNHPNNKKKQGQLKVERSPVLMSSNKSNLPSNDEQRASRFERLKQQINTLPRQNKPGESGLDKVAHLAGLSWEGLAVSMLLTELAFLFRATCQIQYIVDQKNYAELCNTQPDMVYQERNGQYPKIYPIDLDSNGNYKVNYESAPYSNTPPYPQRGCQMSYHEIVANGYVPPPTHSIALKKEFDGYVQEIMGKSLSPEWDALKNELYPQGKPGPAPKSDLAMDQRIHRPKT
jgi:hypothetical protein